ncbi:hypothetical protein GCM10011343_02310 [Flavobacterium orientale]|uniref:Fibronectin type-III domain-containing protein n=2 Tax=Flavobacterium orientale TaxID=1756020 RepID=A0A916XW72_9FLAO|nr:hypothetical protein GCM10011343_02310 [Flavobacterium orientale]
MVLPTAQAQVATNYLFSETSGVAYTEITGGTALVAEGVTFSNAISGAVALGFDFHFDGTNYSQIYVSENGFVTFGVAPAATNYTPISSNPLAPSNYNGAISAYGFRLHNASVITPTYDGVFSSVRYETIGVSPNRVFVVQYKNVIRKAPAPALTNYVGLLNFQIRINESTNVIETIYNTFDPTGAGSITTAQVGLRGPSNTFATNVNNRTTTQTNWLPTSPGIANTTGLALNTSFYNNSVVRFTWTPCFSPSNLTATLQPDNSTAIMNWTAPNLPPASYMYEVRTSGAPGSGATGLFASGTTALTTQNILGLQENVTYSFYVKSSCSPNWVPVNTFPSSVTVSPVCPNGTFPYFEDFEGVTVPGLPFCTRVQVVAGNAMLTRDNTASPYFGFASKNLATQGNSASNTWFFTRKIPFPAAGTYRISYKYGSSRESANFVQKMRVAYGTTNTAAGMTNVIADHHTIKESPLTNAIYITLPAAGEYFIGFNGYANATQGILQIDDISVDYGSCVPPTNLISAQIGYTSAVISWTHTTPQAPGGYQYFVAPTASAITPINTTLPTGSVFVGENVAFVTGLNSSTQYQYWVRSVCVGGEVSEWSLSNTFTTNAPIVYCSPSGAGFPQDQRGITNVAFGAINNTTGIETNNYGDYSYLSTNVPQNTTVPIAITYRTGFTYDTQIWIDWNNDGDFDDDQELVYTGMSTNSNPTTLLASFFVPIEVNNGGNITNTLGEHRLRIGGIDSPSFSGGALTPCRNGAYQAFEDYTIYVIPPPPPLTINVANDVICLGDITTTVAITSDIDDYQVYSWSPSAGVNGNINDGFSFNPLITTVYTLTATQTSGNLVSNSVRFTAVVNQPPSPIVISPVSVSTCSDAPPTPLIANGGAVDGEVVLEDDFNGATTIFTTVNNSTGGSNPANSAWTLRPSPYRNIISNDATQFYVSDGDSQGSGGINDTELISPVFSLLGYTGATLSFWHFYQRFNSTGSARVQVSVDGGTTWTTIQTYTTQQGTRPSFVNVQLDLTPYIGNTNMRIRFKYNDIYGWFWAIDNFRVSASAQTDITWSPSAGLFTDAAGTNPYNDGEAAAVVYAKPNVPTTYTATAENPITFCFTTTTVNVSFIAPGNASGAQSSCNPADFTPITLAGNSGNVVRWEYADNAAFTVNLTTINNTTTTLTPAEFGTITSNRYFRAVVGSGGCSNVVSNGVLVSVPSTVWNGAWSNGNPTSATKAVFNIAGSYTLPGSLSACTLEVVSGTITVPSNATMWVKNNVIVQPGATLIFENNASLVQEEDFVNSGSIIYRRDAQPMYKNDYTYWSSPVTGQDIRLFSPLTKQDKYFTFNNVVDNWSSVFTASDPSPSHIMVPAQGYIIRAPENFATFPTTNNFTGVFTGVPNNGPYTASINATGTSNWNLIGNPYPSAIDIHQFWQDTSNSSVVDATIYLWTHNTQYAGGVYNPNDYAVYNYTGTAATAPGLNTSVPTQYIAAGQSFFIEGATNGVATFRNSMRVSGSNNLFFRTMNTPVTEDASHSWERHRIWLGISNTTTGAYKQALVGYIQNATNGIDRGFDGKSIEAGNTLNLYTFAANQILTIQGKALPFNDSDLIPVGYRAATAGGYSISLDQFDGLFATQAIYLEDLLLQTVHDLKVSPYLFTTTSGTHNQRFQLRFTNVTLGVDEVLLGSNQMIAFKSGDGLVVKSSETLLESVAVYDLRGRLLVAKTAVNALETQWEQLPFAQQVLLVKMVDVDGVEVVRKVVF